MTTNTFHKLAVNINYKSVTTVLLTICMTSLILLPSVSHELMYKGLNGLAGPSNFQYIRGTVETPSPTFTTTNQHKDYMVFTSDSLTGFTAGSGLYFQKTSTSTLKCFLKLFANDPISGPTNYHWVTCTPQPSGNIAVKIEQTADEGYTWKGTSGGYTQTYTFTNALVKNPAYFGSVAGSTHNDSNLYSKNYDLYTKKWGSSEQTFSATTTNQKCFTNSGYNFDYNTNVNNVRTGPPTITWQECTQQQEDYRPHGEWD